MAPSTTTAAAEAIPMRLADQAPYGSRNAERGLRDVLFAECWASLIGQEQYTVHAQPPSQGQVQPEPATARLLPRPPVCSAGRRSDRKGRWFPRLQRRRRQTRTTQASSTS